MASTSKHTLSMCAYSHKMYAAMGTVQLLSAAKEARTMRANGSWLEYDRTSLFWRQQSPGPCSLVFAYLHILTRLHPYQVFCIPAKQNNIVFCMGGVNLRCGTSCCTACIPLHTCAPMQVCTSQSLSALGTCTCCGTSRRTASIR